jgi:hypothetical protein
MSTWKMCTGQYGIAAVRHQAAAVRMKPETLPQPGVARVDPGSPGLTATAAAAAAAAAGAAANAAAAAAAAAHSVSQSLTPLLLLLLLLLLLSPLRSQGEVG